MMGPIQATTRTLSATFNLEDSINLSKNWSRGLEKSMINNLIYEMYIGQTDDDEISIQIEVEQYDE